MFTKNAYIDSQICRISNKKNGLLPFIICINGTSCAVFLPPMFRLLPPCFSCEESLFSITFSEYFLFLYG